MRGGARGAWQIWWGMWSDGGHRGAMSNRRGAVHRCLTLQWVVRNIPKKNRHYTHQWIRLSCETNFRSFGSISSSAVLREMWFGEFVQGPMYHEDWIVAVVVLSLSRWDLWWRTGGLRCPGSVFLVARQLLELQVRQVVAHGYGVVREIGGEDGWRRPGAASAPSSKRAARPGGAAALLVRLPSDQGSLGPSSRSGFVPMRPATPQRCAVSRKPLITWSVPIIAVSGLLMRAT